MTKLSQLILKMTEYEDGCVERVNHFLKVFAFAKTIAEGEEIDGETQAILEAAAIVHDIGIRVCLEKYGNCDGRHQEAEGPAIAAGMLPACGYTAAQCERICYLIAHHHTYTDIDGTDYQILVEADFLVNLFENGMGRETAQKVRDNIFRTRTGSALLTDLFL
ncbi:MAG: HD domain-containing protein [Hominenteromicrobium sp.]